MKAFFSYHLPQPNDDRHVSDEAFAGRVRSYLQTQSPVVDIYFYPSDKRADPFPGQLAKALTECDVFVLFAGRQLGEIQGKEAAMAFERHQQAKLSKNANPIALLVVGMEGTIGWPIGTDNAKAAWIRVFEDIDPITCGPSFQSDPSGVHEGNAQRVAQQVCSRLGMGAQWKPDFEIPVNYPFPYEKRIIEEFIKGGGRLADEWLLEGCPRFWPTVEKRPANLRNLVPPELIGKFSEEESCVVVDARAYLLEKLPENEKASHGLLTFAEARPRKMLRLPHPERLSEPGRGLNIGVVVSGGIAPGINSVVAGIVDRHTLYQRCTKESRECDAIEYSLEIHGYLNGFKSLEQQPVRSIRLDSDEMKRRVREEANRGGSLLGTSRMDALLSSSDPAERSKRFSRMVANLRAQAIDVLYVIGGDGSMRAAHALQVAARRDNYDLAVVGIPKTMDNDILWVWQSFGFLSAVEKAKEFIMQLHTEATSNPRLCVMQLFGSDSGFVVSHAALASGVVDLALIPEIDFSMRKVSAYMKKKLSKLFAAGRSPSGLVLMSETAIPTDVEEYIARDDALPEKDKVLRLDQEEKDEIRRYLTNKKRVRGQTPDALRTGGLKIVSRILQDEIKKMTGDYWSGFRVFTNEPRHLLRSLEPSSSDIIFGHRLGCLAVDNAMAGFTDFMVSQWLTEFVLAPLQLVVLGRKRVPPEGIFWRSVLDSTGQDADLK